MRDWNISKTQYKISDFISWKKNKTLILSPSFQRRPVWKPASKSYLLDTIIRGLPIPIIFLRDRKTSLDEFEPIREVVDGQQRIRTLISFVNPKLLEDFRPDRDQFAISRTHNKDFADKAFGELPKDIKQAILDYQFSVHVLPSEVDDREVLQIFARMNSTGVKLNDQELRNAEYFGEFKTSVYENAFRQLQRWRDWGIFTEDNIARMDEVELTSELYGLILVGLTGKTQRAIDRLYGDHDAKFPHRSAIEGRFCSLMDMIDDAFGKELPSTVFRKKTLFFVLFAATYEKAYGLGSALKHSAANRVTSSSFHRWKHAAERIADGTAPKEVLDATGRRTTHLGERTKLFTYLRDA